MKDKFNKLFPNGLDFDTDVSESALLDRYNQLTNDHVKYIENATLNFADMYEMLESLQEDYPLSHHKGMAIGKLLKRAKG